jgi:hypothetical protein
MFKSKENYLAEAQKNEKVFKMILNHWHKPTDLTVEELYTKYSTGHRYGIWTILDFKEISPNVFEFSQENIATLSGSGSIDLWTIENEELKYLKNLTWWRS